MSDYKLGETVRTADEGMRGRIVGLGPDEVTLVLENGRPWKGAFSEIEPDIPAEERELIAAAWLELIDEGWIVSVEEG